MGARQCGNCRKRVPLLFPRQRGWNTVWRLGEEWFCPECWREESKGAVSSPRLLEAVLQTINERSVASPSRDHREAATPGGSPSDSCRETICLTCAQCGKAYRLGDDAFALTTSGSLNGFTALTVISAGPRSDNREDPDLIDSCDWNTLRRADFYRGEIISICSAVMGGGSRWWKCRKCGEVQTYEPRDVAGEQDRWEVDRNHPWRQLQMAESVLGNLVEDETRRQQAIHWHSQFSQAMSEMVIEIPGRDCSPNEAKALAWNCLASIICCLSRRSPHVISGSCTEAALCVEQALKLMPDNEHLRDRLRMFS